MSKTPLVRLLTLILMALLTSCALMSRPQPMTTLQLIWPVSDDQPEWPAAIELGAVRAVAALQGNRVLVVDGAVLMQHDGLRWVDAPAIMFAERLRILHLHNVQTGAASPAGVARFELWLTEFNIRVAADGSQTVVVAASSSLNCSNPALTQRIAPALAEESLGSSDPQRIALAFAVASEKVVARLLSAAAKQAARCVSE